MKGALKRDWTRGSITGNLWAFSWPVIVTATVTNIGPTIDMMWVGKLGAPALAAVGISGMIVNLMNLLRQGLQTGTRAMVARFIGAGDEQGANAASQQTLVVTVGFAIIMAAIGVFFSRQILSLMGVEPEVVAEGTAYLRIQLVGMLALSFQMMTQSIMQASGDSVLPMKISIGGRLCHILFSPLFIFGWEFFPRLGVAGAAVATILGQGLAGGLGMWMLYTGRTRLRLTMRNFHFDWKLIWRIVKIGIPATLNGAERNMANLIVTWFVVPFGTLAVGAHTLLDRLDRFAQMPAQGLGQGAGVLGGQSLGSSQPERAEKTGWLAASSFTAGIAVASVALWFWAEPIVRVFNAEPDMVQIASAFLRIQIISYLVFGYAQVLQQYLNGVGDTLIPLLMTWSSMWLVQMPLAYLLSRVTGLGVYGVRWGIAISLVIRAAAYATYFKLGRWKLKKV